MLLPEKIWEENTTVEKEGNEDEEDCDVELIEFVEVVDDECVDGSLDDSLSG